MANGTDRMVDAAYGAGLCWKLILSSYTRADTCSSQATSLDGYERCTTELDVLQGHDVWKITFDSIEPDYNPDIIQTNMKALKEAADLCDIGAMHHLLRTKLSRDLGGMSLLRLYKHSWFGTKKLIGDYIETAVATIEKLLEVTDQCRVSMTESRFYQKSLEDALKYFGRSALTLSGGANLGMKHIGVVKALWEAELLPDIISGASAGSIVAGIVGSSTDQEMVEVLQRFPTSDLDVFDPPGVQGLRWVKERGQIFLETRAFFAISNLERVMKSWLKDITFREAHNKTGRTLNICVSSFDSSEARLLNYITAPDVYIWSAVCASCSVPFVFQPATIYEKDPKTSESKIWMLHSQQWVDGSLDSDIPMRKLSEMFNVNYFIVSQVNPHVRVFLEAEEEFNGVQPNTPAPPRSRTRTAMTLAREEYVHRMQILADMGAPNVLTRGASVFSQQYTGDINIFPEIEKREYISMLANPTPEFMRHSTAIGEKATWPKMCQIKNSVAIEAALIRAINVFRDRVNFGPEAARARQSNSDSNRDRSGRARRPSFLRRRSLSNEVFASVTRVGRVSGPPSPSPRRGIKRNSSAGNLGGRLIGFTPTRPPVLATQAGVGNEYTTRTTEDSSPEQSQPSNWSKRKPELTLDVDTNSDREILVAGDELGQQSFGIRSSPVISQPSSPVEVIKNYLGARLLGSPTSY